MSGIEAIPSEQIPPPLSLTQAVQGYIDCVNNKQTDFYKDCAGVGINGSYTTAITQLLESNVSLDELINSYFIIDKQIKEWNNRSRAMGNAIGSARTMQEKILNQIKQKQPEYQYLQSYKIIQIIQKLYEKMEEGKKGSASGGTKRGKFHSLKTKTYKKRTNKKLKRKRSTQKKLKK